MDDAKSPLDNVYDEELRARVEMELKSVAEPYRTTVILRDIEELSYEQIAEVMEVSLGTVKSRLMRDGTPSKETGTPPAVVWRECGGYERRRSAARTVLSAARKSRSCHEMLGCEAAHVAVPGRCGYSQRNGRSIENISIPALIARLDYLALQRTHAWLAHWDASLHPPTWPWNAGCGFAGDWPTRDGRAGRCCAFVGRTCSTR